MTTALTKAGFWRKTADSSSLREPRVLIRVYVGEGEIDRTIAFYEQLHGVTADMRFDFPEHRLVLAAVGPFLIWRGRKSSCALSAAPSARYWSMTFIPITSGCWPPEQRFSSARWRCPPAPVSMRACRTARLSSTCITGRVQTNKPPQGSTGFMA